MKWSQLKCISNNTCNDIDLYKYLKQRSLVLNVNKKREKKFLNSLLTENGSKPF